LAQGSRVASTMLRLFVASLLSAAALCAFFSGTPRYEFQPVVTLLPATAAGDVVPLGYGPATAYPMLVDPRAADPVMAVPKKRTSKMKTRSRKANWYAKAKRQAELAWSRAKSNKAKIEDFPEGRWSDDDDDDEEDEE